jgi:uncharacterized delta-60 repeat protein
MHMTRQARRARRIALAVLTTAALALATAGAAGAAPTDLDRTFGIGGSVFAGVPDETDQAYAVAVQPDGKIVVAGATYRNYDAIVARFNPDGTPDRSFDGDGIRTIDSAGLELVTDIALQPDGKIVLVGSTSVNFDGAVYRLTAQGELDKTFDQDGAVGIDSGGQENLNAVAIQPDGRIVVAGSTTVGNDAAVYRLLTTGELDKTFDGDGARGIDSGGTEYVNGLALQPDGKIVVTGFTSVGDDATVYRLLTSGAPDTTFDQDGAVGIDFGGLDHTNDVVVQPDGRIVVVGTGGPNEDAAVARLTATGQPDPAFGTAGEVLVDAGGEEILWDVLLQPDGRILGTGETTNGVDGLLLRLGTDGGRDASFGDNGAFTLGASGLEELYAAALQDDGRLVVAGHDESVKSDILVFRLQGLRVEQTAGGGQNAGQGGGGGGSTVTGGGGASKVASCAGRRATIVGTRGRDVLRGTPKRDVIAALGGNDVIRALGANDVVCGGGGNDVAIGGAGRDLLLGNAGRDRLLGGLGVDRLLGGAGRDLRRQ